MTRSRHRTWNASPPPMGFIVCRRPYTPRTSNDSDYVAYGTYEPLSVTITHILNNKSGVSFTSYCHTGLPVAVFASGAGAEEYRGYYDNTAIYAKMAAALGVK